MIFQITQNLANDSYEGTVHLSKALNRQNKRNSDKKENQYKNLPLSLYPLLSKLSAYMDKPVLKLSKFISLTNFFELYNE